MHLGVLVLIKKLKDTKVEAGGQRLANAKARGQKLVDIRIQKSEDQRDFES